MPSPTGSSRGADRGGALNTLETLERLIGAVPPPAQGHVRVYRGQTQNFPGMLPSACRPNARPTGRLWEMALHQVPQARVAAADPPVDDTTQSLALMMNLAVWFKVLAQHYGPGSPYLDVTTSPEVALWFALNENQSAEALGHFQIAHRGLGSVRIVCPTLRFSPRMADVGWFFVLDVPRSDGTGVPAHGDLLELEAGPEFVSSCLRVVRQHGGLVFGDSEISGGDLSRYYACPPIPVTRPFEGCPFIDRDAAFLFPGPDEDDWYERLLQAPLILQPSETYGFEHRQSLGVYLVIGANDENAEALLDRQLVRLRPLARSEFRTMPDARRDLREKCGVDPELATYIQVEIPLLTGLPPADRWNQPVLATGMSKRCRPRVESTGEMLPAVSLENVLIQLSPLESALVDAHADADIVTALWLVRRRDAFLVTVFTAPHAPRTAAEGGTRILGPIEIAFDEPTGCFVTTLGSGRQPLLQVEALHDVIVKTFFVTLDIIRGLSATLKPDAYPSFTIDDRLLVPLRRDSILLARAKADPSDLRLHFLRCTDTLRPYMGPGLDLPSAGHLLLEAPLPFAQLRSLHDIYRSARELVLDGLSIDLPAREKDDGVSDRVASCVLNVLESARTDPTAVRTGVVQDA